MRTYKIHLIRHGLTAANEQGFYCGSTDIGLSPAGHAGLAQLLDSAEYPYVERVYASPMLRALETANILFPDTELMEIDDLRETSFGEFEGKSMKELESNPKFQKWVAPAGDYIPDGAENPADYLTRSCAAMLAITGEMMREKIYSAAVVTHAGVIANILASLAFPQMSPYEWRCEPGCGFTAIADPTIYMRQPVFEVIREIPHADEQTYDETEYYSVEYPLGEEDD